MQAAIFLAGISAFCFLGLARAAVRTPRRQFRAVTLVMAILAAALALIDPAAGIALLAPVLLSRRLANEPMPATVDELLARVGAPR